MSPFRCKISASFNSETLLDEPIYIFMPVIKNLNHEKSLQALSKYDRMEAVELEKEIDYEFLELNKKRHATKHFTDKPVDPKDVRTAIEIATLAPSAHNSQPWKFVVVREKNAELAKLAYGSNFEQVSSAPVTIALFTDTDLAKRARKIARVGGANNFSEEQLQYFMKNLPAEFARYNEQQVSDYLPSMRFGCYELGSCSYRPRNRVKSDSWF